MKRQFVYIGLISVLTISVMAGCGKKAAATGGSTANQGNESSFENTQQTIEETTAESTKEKYVRYGEELGVSVSGELGTGVKLSVCQVPTGGSTYSTLNMHMLTLSGASGYLFYNIALLDQGGKTVQPAGEITVDIHIPSQLISDVVGEYRVYCMDASRNVTELVSEVQDGRIIFQTNTMGTIAIVKFSNEIMFNWEDDEALELETDSSEEQTASEQETTNVPTTANGQTTVSVPTTASEQTATSATTTTSAN